MAFQVYEEMERIIAMERQAQSMVAMAKMRVDSAMFVLSEALKAVDTKDAAKSSVKEAFDMARICGGVVEIIRKGLIQLPLVFPRAETNAL